MERGRPQGGGRRGRRDTAAAAAEKRGRPDRVERVVEQKKDGVRGPRLSTTAFPYHKSGVHGISYSGKGAREC